MRARMPRSAVRASPTSVDRKGAKARLAVSFKAPTQFAPRPVEPRASTGQNE